MQAFSPDPTTADRITALARLTSPTAKPFVAALILSSGNDEEVSMTAQWAALQFACDEIHDAHEQFAVMSACASLPGNSIAEEGYSRIEKRLASRDYTEATREALVVFGHLLPLLPTD